MQTSRPLGRYTVCKDAQAKLKEARLNRRLRQGELGLLLGYRSFASGQQMVCKMEQDPNPRLDMVLQAAAALGLHLEEVLSFEPFDRNIPAIVHPRKRQAAAND